jgi:hypothetical protein
MFVQAGLGKLRASGPRRVCSMDRERVHQLLRDDSQAAKKRLRDTTEYLDLAIQQHRNPGPTKITEERVRYAARSYREAIGRAAFADSRLRDFETRGMVPDDLQVRRFPQRAGSLVRSQKLA